MLTTAETAKEVRQALKSGFPGIKFSVRSSIYAGGSSISVKWTDGPTEKAVKVITSQFEGAYLGECGGDMIKMYRDNQYGADYVNTTRKLSKEFLTSIATQYCERYHEEMPEIRTCGEDAYIQSDPIDYWCAGNEIMRLVADTDEKDLNTLFANENAEEPVVEEAQAEETIAPVEESQECAINEAVIEEPAYEATAGELYEAVHSTPRQQKLSEAYDAWLEDVQAAETTIDPQPVEIPTPETDTEEYVDPRSNINATTIYRFDPVSRIHWLEFYGKPEQTTIDLLKKEGWRWSRYRKQWHTNRRWAQVPEGVDYYNDGECDYAAERSDRLEARSEKNFGKFQEHRAKSDAISSMIPMGQPILVGHHSERRHRRDLDRIWTNEGKAWENYNKAKDLHERAESSQQHQAYLERPDVISRRIQRLEKELRTYEGYTGEEYRRRATLLKQEIAEHYAKLRAAGGLPVDHVMVETGDIILIDGFIGRVEGKPRAGGKTFRITITEGGAKGMELTLDRSKFKKIIQKYYDVAS